MNRRSSFGIGLGLAEDFVSQGSDVPLAEQHEPGQILERIPLGLVGPAEVDVGPVPRLVAQCEQDRLDHVGDGGGPRALTNRDRASETGNIKRRGKRRFPVPSLTVHRRRVDRDTVLWSID